MHVRFLLAPVICMMVMGLIGTDYGQAAQIPVARGIGTNAAFVSNDTAQEQSVQKRHSKHSSHKTKAAKKHSAKTAKKKHTHDSAVVGKKHHKKIRFAKHKGKTLKHRHAMISEVDIDIDAMSSNDTGPKEPVDFWLAKDAHDRFMQGSNDGELDELTMKILESAYSYLGVPYRYGGTTPDGFDCSGFVRYVFSENGIPLGRSSRDQALEGKAVPLSDLKPGDLLFFNMHHRKHSWIDHVGLYVGNGQFIHAASRHSREIKIEDLEGNRYLPRIVEARRVLDYTR